MKKYIQNFIFLGLLLAILILPNFTSAAQVTITSIVNSLFTTISYLAGVIAIICWVITGLMFLTAMGDPSKVTTARKALIFAIIGTAIALLAGTAPSLVGSAIGL